MPERVRLGMVVDGSLEKGVEVRLESPTTVEDIKVGHHVTVRGKKTTYFGIITDVALRATDPRLKASPPDVSNPLIYQVVSGTAAYGTISVRLYLTLLTVIGDPSQLQNAKTVPPHFSDVYLASEQEEEAVFGREDGKHFWIGNPLDMETKVCLDLEKLVMRSNGVFGKSGTGKTFLTFLLLVGILQKNVASCLVFDMHNEYGWGTRQENGAEVKGLKQLFTHRVAVFTLDEESSRKRGCTPDFTVRIGFEEIEPEDVDLLKSTLNLSDVAASYAYPLVTEWGKGWVLKLLQASNEELLQVCGRYNLNMQALGALRNRLLILKRFPFLDPDEGHRPVERILEYIQQGKHVVLEFGRYGRNLTAYILVANILTRRIHERYVEMNEKALGSRTAEPRQLVIVIEEAHKFLTSQLSQQTIFGTIARELRKYNVTLLLIDQRPSSIDPEVMSQVGTKLTCLLDDERDVDAVLSGVSGMRELRTVLSRLESKQQALIFGHAVPLPVVVRVRDYGSPKSYSELMKQSERSSSADEELNELFR